MARTVVTRMIVCSVVAILLPFPSQAYVLDLEEFPVGMTLATGDLGHGITLSVINNDSSHPDAAVIFDSSCDQPNLPPCSGSDSDLRTPGAGIGNTVAQGNLMIIAENSADNPQCPFQSDCDGGIRSLVMVYHGAETNVTIEACSKKFKSNNCKGDLWIFNSVNPGDVYEIDSAAVGKDKLGSSLNFRIKNAGGGSVQSSEGGHGAIETSSLHTSCSRPIWSGMMVGTRQQLVCFDSRNIVDDDDCTLVGSTIVCEDASSPEAPDGLADDPDDEKSGGTITLTFADPVKCSSIRAIDIETSEVGDRLELSLVAGGTQVVPFALLGDNSAQTVAIPNPAPINELKIILVGSGAIDDITCSSVCGDGVVDAGEQCDDGNNDNGDCCSASCATELAGSACDDGDPCTGDGQCDANGSCVGAGTTCGDGIVDGACGEQCDDSNTASGDCCDSTCQLEASGSACTDDGNVCTDNVCDGNGNCTHPDNAAPCDDGSACTTADTCSSGVCAGGPPPNCDDGNVCTDDSCDPSGGCAHSNNAAPCDDGSACTTADICSSGVCTGGPPPDCDDGNVCTDDSCNPASGCAHSNNTAPCSDGSACTTADTCSNGVCAGGPPPNCDDGNVCTDDSCNPASGCAHSNNTAPCSDGSACTTADTCSNGVCTGGSPLNCDDGDVCTDDSCDPGLGCVYSDNTAPCDDSNACTTADTCGTGICSGNAPLVCDDSNVCTDDTCSPTTGCIFTNNTASCDNANPSDNPDSCIDGVCTGTGGCQGSNANCDDGNLCTDDICLPSGACNHLNNTAACDDANACTTGDTCAAGLCVGGVSPNCDDGNVCTDDTCDPASGCAHANNTASCNDGNACTTNDTCAAGVCVGGVSPNCDDGNVCTDDTCDPASGCAHANNTASCNDGNACTTNDTCAAGVCVGGVSPNCDDGNVCTDDTCDPASGCTHANNTASCNDGNACTTNDTCAAGACVGGVSPNCDDGNVCTDDTCDPASGCAHANNTASCDDGNACTTNDTCAASVCVGGVSPNCDDGNVCTDDTCDPASGCAHTNNTDPCDDGSACTTTDSCAGGICIGSVPPDCDDGNVCTDDACNPASGCAHSNNTDPCDDGDQCTVGDLCNGAGTCIGGGSSCGDGVLDPSCGEVCDDGNNVPNDGCEPDCTPTGVCGDGTLDPAEECDDGNNFADDGCFECQLENVICFEGENARIARSAKRIAFEAVADHLGNNLDRNKEIYVLDRKGFLKLLRKNGDPDAALVASLEQTTNTVGVDVVNETPTLNGSGRFLAFVSNASFCIGGPDGPITQCAADSDCPGGSVCTNLDANKEVFHFDRKRLTLTQVSDTTNTALKVIDNLHPNLRAFQGNLLVFDSTANLLLAPCGPNLCGRCVGGALTGELCTDDVNCPGGSCGNSDGSRELFLWRRRSQGLQQLTTAPDGESIVGRSVNFWTRATAFSSTASLLEPNPEGIRQIFRVVRSLDSLIQITQVDSGSDRCQGGPLDQNSCVNDSDCPGGTCVHASVSEAPSQSKRRVISFMSDADLTGGNADLNREIYLWKESTGFTQVTHTTSCENNEPVVSAKGRFIIFQSTCNLIPSHGNPDQSIFLYDTQRGGLLRQIVLRGPGASSRPMISRSRQVIVFEADTGRMVCTGGTNDGSLCTVDSDCPPDGTCGDEPNRLCIFNTRKELFEGPVIP